MERPGLQHAARRRPSVGRWIVEFCRGDWKSGESRQPSRNKHLPVLQQRGCVVAPRSAQTSCAEPGIVDRLRSVHVEQGWNCKQYHYGQTAIERGESGRA